jgi:hypothetical protein
MENLMPSELQIQRITGMASDGAGTITVRADGLLHDARTELEIAVTTELAPAMALALLATTASDRALRDELAPALDVLAAAVVRSSSGDRVRLQLLFGDGAVLPLELTTEAGHALNDGLTEYLLSPKRRLASRRDGAPSTDPEPGSRAD